MSDILPNQPIQFDAYDGNECPCAESDYKPTVQQSDKMQFQAELNACPGASQLFTDPSFDLASTASGFPWAFTGSWSFIGDGLACKPNDGSTATFTQSSLVLDIDVYYIVEVNVNSIAGGTISLQQSGFTIGTVSTTGLTKIAFKSIGFNLNIVADENCDVCLNSISIYEMNSDVAFGVLDMDGNVVSVYNITDNPEYFTIQKNTVTIAFTWSDLGLDAGCYQIGFASGCKNINGQFGLFNGDFQQSVNVLGILLPNGWTFGVGAGSWTFSASTSGLTVTTSTVGFSSLAVSNFNTNLMASSYECEMNITARTGTMSVTPQIGTNPGPLNYTTTGVKNCTISPSGPDPRRFLLVFQATTASSMTIEYVDVALTNDSDFTFDDSSNAFNLVTTAGTCSNIVNISNDDDAMGLVFVGNNFAPSVRVDSQLINAQYKFTRETYTDNDGNTRVYFGEREKTMYFKIDHIPTWLHDFISLALIADHFFINGIEYTVMDDEYSLDFANDNPNMASVTLLVKPTGAYVQNTNTGNASNPIPVGGVSYLVDFSGAKLIDLSDGSFLINP